MAKEVEVEKQKAVQEKYVQLQMMDSQIKNIQKQLNSLEVQAQDLDIINGNVEDLKSVKEGTEVFVSLATGIFAKAELKSVKELVVNVGANVLVGKTLDDTKDMLSRQVVEIRMIQDELSVQLQRIVDDARRIEKELRLLS